MFEKNRNCINGLKLAGMPTVQLNAGFSSFKTISPAFRSGRSWKLKNFSFSFQAF
jgi:hypothetical protein